MAAHRFWRLFISDIAGSYNYVGVNELAMAESPGGANVCTGGTASASTVNGTYTADKAFDGSFLSTNSWACASNNFHPGVPNSPMNAWLQYDFAATPRDIVEIKVTFPPSGGILTNVNMAPKNFSLYYSDDGLTWVRQRAWSEQSFSFGETKTYDATPLSSILIKNRLVLERNLREIESALGPDIICTTLRGPNFSRAKNNTTPLRHTPYTGNKRIAGSTTSLGVPLARRVDLLDQKSGQLVARINTPSTGEFEFSDLADGAYSLIGVDNTAEQNSVIFAHVAAVP